MHSLSLDLYNFPAWKGVLISFHICDSIACSGRILASNVPLYLRGDPVTGLLGRPQIGNCFMVFLLRILSFRTTSTRPAKGADVVDWDIVRCGLEGGISHMNNSARDAQATSSETRWWSRYRSRPPYEHGVVVMKSEAFPNGV